MGSSSRKSSHKSFKKASSRLPPRPSKKRAYELRSRKRNRAFLLEYLKTHHCVDCGESDLIILEFDHVRGTKTACVKQMARDKSMEALVKEVKKCEVRCSNCHKKRHYYVTHPKEDLSKLGLGV